MMRILLSLFFVLLCCFSKANGIVLEEGTVTDVKLDSSVVYQPKHPRLTAAVLTITLGMLGAHRLYLGAKPWVPLFYVVSVGGVFFILPLLDLIAIISHKDITPFYNNNKILMWLK